VIVLPAGAGDIGREAARRAAREELQDRKYQDAQPPLLVRVVGRLIREFADLLDRAAGGVPGGRVGLLLLALFLGSGRTRCANGCGPSSASWRRAVCWNHGRVVPPEKSPATVAPPYPPSPPTCNARP
jgi:hypothetical protein